ncbi:glycosyltransferase family 2 protein [Kineococcus sp. SYSU DK006]|uniref:glycosyltransferase family 2 protein n=1 Tax=Kineococcus sp. SYSU DK006 TaxID=3383127 RepID=UPI003D7DDDB0
MPDLLDVTVVVATADHRDRLRHSLSHLVDLPGRPPVVVVDNGSCDGSPEMVEAEFGHHRQLELVRLPEDRGALARNEGVRRARTRYVAFSDDDSWWAPQALPRAVAAFEAHPALGLVAARATLVPSGETDRASLAMAAAPLGHDPALPGPPVLGFTARAGVLRAAAFEQVGGFDELVGSGGEDLLSLDLATAGWQQCYLEDVEAPHGPPGPPDPARRAVRERDALLVCWLRRPLPSALRATAALVARAARDGHLGREVVVLARCLPPALLRRRPIARALERSWRTAHAPRPLRHPAPPRGLHRRRPGTA